MEKKDKQKFAKTLTDTEIKRINDMRAFEGQMVSNPTAKRLATLADSLYSDYIRLMGNARKLIVVILQNKRMIDQNQKDVIAGKTEQVYISGSLQGKVKDVDDLKVENMNADNNIQFALSDLRESLVSLFAHFTNIKRIDGIVFFKEEDFNEYVRTVEKELKDFGVDLYFERKA